MPAQQKHLDKTAQYKIISAVVKKTKFLFITDTSNYVKLNGLTTTSRNARIIHDMIHSMYPSFLKTNNNPTKNEYTSFIETKILLLPLFNHHETNNIILYLSHQYIQQRMASNTFSTIWVISKIEKFLTSQSPNQENILISDPNIDETTNDNNDINNKATASRKRNCHDADIVDDDIKLTPATKRRKIAKIERKIKRFHCVQDENQYKRICNVLLINTDFPEHIIEIIGFLSVGMIQKCYNYKSCENLSISLHSDNPRDYRLCNECKQNQKRCKCGGTIYNLLSSSCGSCGIELNFCNNSCYFNYNEEEYGDIEKCALCDCDICNGCVVKCDLCDAILCYDCNDSTKCCEKCKYNQCALCIKKGSMGICQSLECEEWVCGNCTAPFITCNRCRFPKYICNRHYILNTKPLKCDNCLTNSQ